jgi:hypothetical protein
MSSKNKTAAQQAKKAANIAAYQARCAKHAENMKARDIAHAERMANLVAEREAEARRRAEAEEARQRHEAALLAQQNFVQASLSGPSGFALKRWLKNRPATYERVKRFFDERPQLKQAA